mgnify:CR=1 FL=1
MNKPLLIALAALPLKFPASIFNAAVAIIALLVIKKNAGKKAAVN